LVATAIPPDYALSSHVAPLGVAIYTGTDLPANYRGGAFVSERGSWDRSPLNGYKVVFVPFSGEAPHLADISTMIRKDNLLNATIVRLGS
jgi:glucose/arabinose dehydrogenase